MAMLWFASNVAVWLKKRHCSCFILDKILHNALCPFPKIQITWTLFQNYPAILHGSVALVILETNFPFFTT